MNILKLLNSSLLTTSRNLCTRNYDAEIAAFSKMSKKQRDAQINFCKKGAVSVTTTSLEVVGNGANSAPPAVLLNTNYGSYLLNCGEGTMKLAAEYKFKVHKSQIVFITYPSWRNIAGLFGTALSVQDSGGTGFYIHGHKEISNLFNSVNHWIRLRKLYVTVKKCEHYETYTDGIITAKYVILRPSSSSSSSSSSPLSSVKGIDVSSESSASTSETESLASKLFHSSEMGSLSKKREREKSLSPNHKRKHGEKEKGSKSPTLELPAEKCTDSALSFIIKTEISQGTLNFEKCLEHGVPPGPLLGQLKNGIDVTLDNGTIIKSADVKNPDIPGVNIIVLECPTEDYLDSLLGEVAFHDLQREETPAEAVVHFTSASIVKTPKYQEWISRFPRKTLHLFINEENKSSGSAGIHLQQYRLNFVHPEFFPPLHGTDIPLFPRTNDAHIQAGHTKVDKDLPVQHVPIFRDKVYLKCESNSLIRGETLQEVWLRPKSDFHYMSSLVLKKEQFFNEMLEDEEIKAKIHESKQELKDAEQKITPESKTYPKIVFLGTGSSKPSKLRNGSGILIFVNSTKSMLLDCAEFTFGQLVNLYGKAKTKEILRSLEAVFISHMHVDHHMGLITILKERKLAFDEVGGESTASEPAGEASPQRTGKNFAPVYLLAPTQLLKWLTLYSGTFEDITDTYSMISNTYLLYKNKKPHHRIHLCLESLGMSSISTVPVEHCPHSFGISVIHKKGWKITYSGDTMPCQALIEMGMNSDVLIHEATLEDAYAKEAKMKLHSTTSQAIDVGKRMKAKYILLTHFSQRYCHLPYIEPTISNLNVGIAFDFMEVPFDKLQLLPALLKPLKYAFSKYDEIVKNTTESFLLKKEKLRNLEDSEVLGAPPPKVSKMKS